MFVSAFYRLTRCTLSTPGSSTSGRKGSSVILTAASGGETSLQDCVHKTWPMTTSRTPGSPSTSKLSTPSRWAWTRLCPVTADRSVQFSSRWYLRTRPGKSICASTPRLRIVPNVAVERVRARQKISRWKSRRVKTV